jgi:hypothetical protein
MKFDRELRYRASRPRFPQTHVIHVATTRYMLSSRIQGDPHQARADLATAVLPMALKAVYGGRPVE